MDSPTNIVSQTLGTFGKLAKKCWGGKECRGGNDLFSQPGTVASDERILLTAETIIPESGHGRNSRTPSGKLEAESDWKRLRQLLVRVPVDS
ncbi:hypothetical protein PoB_002651000 [Plakobranchus ocellatus]|uniref:Uncharacterized protein n=1 Tax=Plakobranchus ocellatus TaxID=259542 RepID=A0AAV3ZXS4_9GAST|nr:hypothetical protein PoB_002651000 [Plakobranchus ocellatus]